MRRALRDELGLVTPRPVAAEPQRRAIPWQRLSIALSAAAVLLLFVAVVPALDLFGGRASDESSVALPDTTAAEAEVAPDSGRTEMAKTESFASSGDNSTTTGGTDADDGRVIDFGADPDLALVQTASQRGYIETGEAANLLGLDLDLDSLFIDPAVEGCVAGALESFTDGRRAVVLGAGSLGDNDIFVVAYVNDATGTVEIVAHDAATCQVVTSEG